MSSEVVIEASGLGKAYQVYSETSHRFWQTFLGRRKKLYTEYWALRDVDLQVCRGEAVGIIGRNGSGKSTLLQLICGTMRPTAGTVRAAGRVAALLELGAGFNPEFTGRENVYLSAALLGLSRETIAERIEAIIEFASIGDFIDVPVKRYSSGMYARLAFAVAAHVDADILIVDEILAVGDAAFAQKCMRFIRGFKEKGTLLLVTHDSSAVINMCERAVWLDRGGVRAIGPAKQICDEYGRSLKVERDDGQSLRFGGRRASAPLDQPAGEDVRKELLKDSVMVEVFDFDQQAAWFGERRATINSVELRALNQDDALLLRGGERVVIEIKAAVERGIGKPIIGFFVRDRLGQNLFGDNTFITHLGEDLAIAEQGQLTARFVFQLPYLPTGDYSICAAIADGTQQHHVQQHWIDDAMFFRVHSSHVARGLIGVPMLEITLERSSEDAGAPDELESRPASARQG